MTKTQGGLVLLVDDDEAFLELFCRSLAKVGFQTLRASDGAAALNLVEQHNPHVMVSDVTMPTMSGLDLVQKLRIKGIHTPCILVSGRTDKAKILKAIRLGVVDFIEKPFDVKAMVELVKRTVEMGKQMREVEQELERELEGNRVPTERRDSIKRLRLASLLLRSGKSSAGSR